MAKNQGQINFGVNFNVNTASLNKVRETLKNLKAMTKDEIEKSGGKILDLDKGVVHSWTNNLSAMRKEVNALEKAFEAAYNPKLGTYELNKFNESLKLSGTTAAQAFATIANYGADGKAALLDMTTGMLSFERVGKQTNETFKKLGDTMMNTIRWSMTSTAINTVTGAIQQAYNYAIDLDKSLNDIMIVTDKSSREMELFAKSANSAAKALGASTRDYAEASLIYYQQGLSDRDVAARTETTLKAAAITGQSAEQVSEQLTAVWNGYKVSAQESELYIDKLSAVAATTAADLEELSVGMSKVASAANIMGVDIDQLNAQLATIVSVTREAPESIGTALKTVYARMSDIEAGLDTETTLGEYTAQMAQMGINVLDANGKLRDMGAVVEEIGNSWSSLNREQQVSLAQSIAGTRQYSRMMALFDNWDMYQEAMTTSIESAGTLSQQHVEYLQSVEAHQEKLKASAEGLYDTIFDSDQIKGVYDILTGLVEGVNGLVKGLGGMPGILAVLVSLGTTIGKQSLQDLIVKGKVNKMQTQLYKSQIENGKAMIENLKENVRGGTELEKQLNEILDLEDMILNNAGNLTEEQFNKLQAGVKQYSDNLKDAIEVEKKYNTLKTEKEDWKEQTSNGKRLKRTFKEGSQRRIAYDLSAESSSEARIGRDQAKKNLRALQNRADAGQELSESEQEELEYLKKYIPLAERKIELEKEMAQITTDLADANKRAENANKGVVEGIKNEISAIEKASLIADFAQGISMVGMSAAMASGSVQSFASAMSDSSAGFTDIMGGVTGLAGAFFSTLVPIKKANAVIKSTASTAEKAGARIQRAFGWVSLVIGGVTTLIQIAKEFQQAEIDRANASIEAEREKQKEIKTNRELQQSFLDLYEEYEKTGEETQELKTATEQVIEQLEDEALKALAAAGAYEQLAEAIREKTAASYGEMAESAREEKNAAETKLGKIRSGNVSGVRNLFLEGALSTSGINIGSLKKEENAQNAEIIKEVFKGDELFKGQSAEGFLEFKDIIDMSPEEKARFYNKLRVATGHKKWQSKGKLNNNVQQILEDEDIADAVADYNTASSSVAKAEIAESISQAGHSASTSLEQFQKEREALIQKVIDTDPTIEDNEEGRKKAAAIVGTQYQSATNEDTKALYQRNLWIEGQLEAKQLDENVAEDLRKMSLEDVDTATFNALKLVDLETFEGTADELIDAAKEKAKELQDAAWAVVAEARLEAVENNIDRLERMSEKLSGEEKVNNLKKQNELLEKQEKIISKTLDIQRKELQDKTGAFFDLVNNDSIDIIEGQEDAPALQALLAAGEYEVIQDYLGEMEQQDEANALQEALTDIINSSNALADSETQLLDIEDQRLEKYLEMQEANWEIYNDQREQLEENISLLEKQMELQELLTKQSTLSDYSNILAMRQQLLASYQEEYDKNQEELKNNARQLYDQYGIEYVLNLEERQRDLATAIADGTVAVIEAAREEYLQTIKEFSQGIVDNLFGDKFNLDLFNDERDWTAKQSERYYDQIDAAYELTNLEYEYNKAINNAGSLKTQEKLTELKEQQLAALREMDELSESDVKRSMKLLELEQARLALQEAQSNKNTMRLVRGADGTYGYQYVADESKIAEAEQDVARIENELVNLDEEAWKESLDTFYDDFTEFIDKLVAYAEDGTIDEMESSNLKKMYEVLGLDAENAGDMQEYFKATLNALGLPITDIAQAFGVSTKLIEALNNFSNSKDFASFMNNYSGTISGAKDKYQGVVNNPTSNGSTSASQLVEGVINTQSGYKTFDPNEAYAYARGQLTQTSDTHNLKGRNVVAIGEYDGGAAYENNGTTIGLGKGAHLKDASGETQGLTIADDKIYVNGNGTQYVKVHPTDDENWIRWVPMYSLRDLANIENKVYPSFDTGGYTGNWNSADGRLATVHEKELILNKEDTSNFLDALSILRSLNLSMLNNLSQMSGGYGNALSAYEFLREMLIEQNVYINAEFPNASDANEIREAFNELMNLATQHIYTNNRG